MKQSLILLALCLLPFYAFAESENGLWESVSVNKDLGKKWELNGEVDFRTSDLLKFANRAAIGAGGEYKPVKWFKIGAGYTFITDHNPETFKSDYKKQTQAFNGYNLDQAYWRNKHRLYVDLTGKWKWGRFGFAVRERYQYTRNMSAETMRTRYREPISDLQGLNPDNLVQMGDYWFWPDEISTDLDTKSAKNGHRLRSRLSVDYNIRSCPVTPGVSYEIQNNLKEGLGAVKHRVTAGIEWKIKKRHSLSFDYIFQHAFQPEDYEAATLHVLSVGAKIKL